MIIKINRSELISAVEELLSKKGDSGYGIYINVNVDDENNTIVDVRHNTDINADWEEIINGYDFTLENAGKYPGDDGYNYNESATWLVEEIGVLPNDLDIYINENLENVDFDLV